MVALVIPNAAVSSALVLLHVMVMRDAAQLVLAMS